MVNLAAFVFGLETVFYELAIWVYCYLLCSFQVHWVAQQQQLLGLLRLMSTLELAML